MKYAATMTILLTLAINIPTGAQERPRLARFDGGIGVIPASSPALPANQDGTFQNVKQNVVRDVLPAGVPWRIAELSADIDVDGGITVKGRGLLVAGGNSIGQNANQRVFATLICESVGPFTQHSTPSAGVPLDLNGDFRIDDTLSDAPSTCLSPVLLIRSSGSGAWFAAGIPASNNGNQ